MKFKTPIEVQAGISDGDPTNPLGISGYLLSSDGSNVNWVSPGGLSAETAEAIVQPIKANEALVKGDPLYIVGYQTGQGVNIVAKADSSDVAKMPVVGLADDDYANQAFGTMTAFGSFNGDFDTTGGTESWAVGDIIFVKPGGGLTNIKPGGTDLIQNVAIVSRVNSQTGELEVIALGRTNDVPNLPTGRLFVGTAANTSLASDVIYVDDTNDRVGIGTTSPSTVLEVSSTGVNGVDISQSASNASQSGRLFFTTNTASEGFALFNSNGTFQVNSGGIPNNTSGTNRISIIGSSGNVGIGTTSPGATLEVQGKNSNTEAALKVTDSGDSFFEVVPNNTTTFKLGDIDAVGDESVIVGTFSDITFSKGGTVTMILDSNNRVGIGTTSPAKKLTIGGIGIGNTDGLKIEDPSNTAYGAHFSFDDGSTSVEIGGVTNNTLNDCISIARDATRTITIDTSERVGIGDTTPSYKLDVNGTGRFTDTLYYSSLVQQSQADTKKDIANIDKNKATAIPFKQYKYKTGDTERVRYGVVVEDIEQYYPELVHIGEDGIKGVSYIDLLVKRVAELEKELEDISLTPGPKGDTGATGATGAAGANGADGSNGADGNSHLSNITSIAFNPKANRLQVNIGGTVYNFAPSK